MFIIPAHILYMGLRYPKLVGPMCLALTIVTAWEDMPKSSLPRNHTYILQMSAWYIQLDCQDVACGAFANWHYAANMLCLIKHAHQMIENFHRRQCREEEIKKVPLGFVPRISCLLDKCFNQLSHGTSEHQGRNWPLWKVFLGRLKTCHWRNCHYVVLVLEILFSSNHLTREVELLGYPWQSPPIWDVWWPGTIERDVLKYLPMWPTLVSRKPMSSRGMCAVWVVSICHLPSETVIHPLRHTKIPFVLEAFHRRFLKVLYHIFCLPWWWLQGAKFIVVRLMG